MRSVSTSTRTFVLWPLAILVERAVTRQKIRIWPMVGALAGYALYRGAGSYRTARGGGGPGMANPPDRLVTTGPYAYTRNPMYLGHLVAFASYTLATRSLAVAALAGWHVRWFDDRAAADERGLARRFGAPFEEYGARVPRWLPGWPLPEADVPPVSDGITDEQRDAGTP